MGRIKEECKKKLDWLNEIIGKQNELHLHKDPIITTAQIKKETEVLKFICNADRIFHILLTQF